MTAMIFKMSNTAEVKDGFDVCVAWQVSFAGCAFSDLLVLSLAERQRAGDSAMCAVVTASVNGSAGGRSSADDWEGGVPCLNIQVDSTDRHDYRPT